MGLWWFCCIQINAAYKSKLSTFFIKSEKSDYNISKFLINGYELILNQEDSFMFDQILETVGVNRK